MPFLALPSIFLLVCLFRAVTVTSSLDTSIVFLILSTCRQSYTSGISICFRRCSILALNRFSRALVFPAFSAWSRWKQSSLELLKRKARSSSLSLRIFVSSIWLAASPDSYRLFIEFRFRGFVIVMMSSLAARSAYSPL